LAISLYRFCHGSAGREPQPWCCCYHFVADDTVESLISFTDFIIKKEVMELKTANHLLQLRYQLSWQVRLKNTFSKQGAYLKTNLKVENFDYPSVNVIAKVDGTDPKLKEEYVLFSGHQDHDGVGPS
jgi:hypothetical protein